jgi:hypothetical protein
MALGKGKKKNTYGTQPRKKAVDAPGPKPGRRSVKAGPGGRTGPKHAATRSEGVRTRVTRKAGPKKTRRGTTTRSGDK